MEAPRNADGVTAEWLSDVLGAPVANVELEATGAAGFVSDTYRATLSYAPGDGGAPGREILRARPGADG